MNDTLVLLSNLICCCSRMRFQPLRTWLFKRM